MAEKLRKNADQSPPRTGVGTPDQHAEAAGAELGGDTGDVGTPRDEIGDSFGGTRGTSGIPEASDVVQPGPGKGTAHIKKRAA